MATFIVAHAPYFLIRTLDIGGLVQLTPQEVQAAAGIPPGAFIWEIRPWSVERRLEGLPLVAQAAVRLAWPNRVVIRLVERVPVAVLALSGTRGWELDASGRVLMEVPLAAAAPGQIAPEGLPVVHLSVSPPVHLGQVLDGIPAVRAAVAVAAGLGVEGRQAIGQMAVDDAGNVTLWTRDGIAVRFGDAAEARRKVEVLLGLLEVVRRQGLHPAYIDVQSPANPSVRLASPQGGVP